VNTRVTTLVKSHDRDASAPSVPTGDVCGFHAPPAGHVLVFGCWITSCWRTG